MTRKEYGWMAIIIFGGGTALIAMMSVGPAGFVVNEFLRGIGLMIGGGLLGCGLTIFGNLFSDSAEAKTIKRLLKEIWDIFMATPTSTRLFGMFGAMFFLAGLWVGDANAIKFGIMLMFVLLGALITRSYDSLFEQRGGK